MSYYSSGSRSLGASPMIRRGIALGDLDQAEANAQIQQTAQEGEAAVKAAPYLYGAAALGMGLLGALVAPPGKGVVGGVAGGVAGLLGAFFGLKMLGNKASAAAPAAQVAPAPSQPISFETTPVVPTQIVAAPSPVLDASTPTAVTSVPVAPIVDSTLTQPTTVPSATTYSEVPSASTVTVVQPAAPAPMPNCGPVPGGWTTDDWARENGCVYTPPLLSASTPQPIVDAGAQAQAFVTQMQAQAAAAQSVALPISLPACGPIPPDWARMVPIGGSPVDWAASHKCQLPSDWARQIAAPVLDAQTVVQVTPPSVSASAVDAGAQAQAFVQQLQAKAAAAQAVLVPAPLPACGPIPPDWARMVPIGGSPVDWAASHKCQLPPDWARQIAAMTPAPAPIVDAGAQAQAFVAQMQAAAKTAGSPPVPAPLPKCDPVPGGWTTEDWARENGCVY